MGMKPPASMSEIGNFLVSWKKAQEEKAEAASLSDILKDVLALSYKGEDRKIAEELEKSGRKQPLSWGIWIISRIIKTVSWL